MEALQNEYLRICLGAFKLSIIVSLQVEANTIPLKYRRDVISLKLFFKMESNPQSLTYEMVMDGNNRDNPLKERLLELKNIYSINESKIEAQKYYLPIPVTSLSPIEVFDFLPLTKKKTT